VPLIAPRTFMVGMRSRCDETAETCSEKGNTTSELPARHSPRSAAAQQNSHFRMERQVRMLLEGGLTGLVTLVFAKCKNKVLASLRSSDG